jgi:hypothetical protein
LLDREPKESILGSFDVTVISRYFPEFERELPNYLSPPQGRCPLASTTQQLDIQPVPTSQQLLDDLMLLCDVRVPASLHLLMVTSENSKPSGIASRRKIFAGSEENSSNEVETK